MGVGRGIVIVTSFFGAVLVDGSRGPKRANLVAGRGGKKGVKPTAPYPTSSGMALPNPPVAGVLALFFPVVSGLAIAPPQTSSAIASGSSAMRVEEASLTSVYL
jgi:hypothetical protein